MDRTMKRGLREKLGDDLRFFRSWLGKPKLVGSVVPTSWTMAQRMASVIDPNSTLPILELGPGTGITTRAIIARGIDPKRIVSVEFSPEFCAKLRADFPGVEFIEGDALNLAKTLGPHAATTFDCVISSLPLLYFPMEQRIALVEDVLDRIPTGRPMLQFTYGWKPSVPRGRGNYTVEYLDMIFRNIPPAQLWLYRRPTKG
jgi:phosphatidylethanolamine/phosphatidyl-N-methylethanolamine N-methyltransferase